MLHIIGIIIAAYVVIGLLGFWQGVRPDEALLRSQMHLPTWTELLHRAIDRRRRRRRERRLARGQPFDAFEDRKKEKRNTAIVWALALVAFLLLNPYGFALTLIVSFALALIVAVAWIGGDLVVRALTGGLGPIHQALIEKSAAARLSALIHHRG